MLLLSGSAHGSHEEKGFMFQQAVILKAGTNHIAILGMTVGLPVRISEIDFSLSKGF